MNQLLAYIIMISLCFLSQTKSFSIDSSTSFGRILFTELMADPTPIVGNLPDVEYIEIYNNTSQPIITAGWQLWKNDKAYAFPSDTIASYEYAIMGSSKAMDTFDKNTPKITFTSFPTLNNTGTTLYITDGNNELIDFLSYSDQWHNDDFKGDGGFSLERLSVDNPSQENNWSSSRNNNGGTPGQANSISNNNDDYTPPSIVSAFANDSSSIMIKFSEYLTPQAINKYDYYTLSANLNIEHILLPDSIALNQQIELKTNDNLQESKIYYLEVKNLQDLSGNEIIPVSLPIAICPLPSNQNIIINELMIDPLSGEEEYIELFNNSPYPFDLSKLKISKRNSEGNWESGKAISEDPFLLLPQSYVVLCKNPDALLNQYDLNTSQTIGISSMPSLTNEEGNIAILRFNATVIDEVNYNEDWHSPLLNDAKGVALERININAPSSDPNNWFSASTINNYGTPGLINSQSNKPTPSSYEIKIAPQVITPDGDGLDDYLNITIPYKYSEGSARIKVFNHRGIQVQDIANNALLSGTSSFTWDGTNTQGQRCPMGAYIIWIEIINSRGTIYTEKLDCAISARID